MTDDERLLEIATSLLGKGSLVIIDTEIVLAFDAAERILKTWRERTGSHEDSEQDVPDELIQSAIDACDIASLATGAVPYWERKRDALLSIQRARAAGKGDQ